MEFLPGYILGVLIITGTAAYCAWRWWQAALEAEVLHDHYLEAVEELEALKAEKAYRTERAKRFIASIGLKEGEDASSSDRTPPA